MPPSVACADVLNVDREPEAVRPQRGVQRVEHEARLDRRRHRCRGRPRRRGSRCLLWSMTSAAPTVWPHCELPAPRGRIGTRELAAICERDARTSSSLSRHQHADRLDLVDRRVGRVAPARGRVEQHLAFDRAGKARRERPVAAIAAGERRGDGRPVRSWSVSGGRSAGSSGLPACPRSAPGRPAIVEDAAPEPGNPLPVCHNRQ